MVRRTEGVSKTPFSDGKFEQFCRGRGLSVEQVAEKSGISLRTIQRWIRGETMPLAESWTRLAKAFGFVDADQLWLAYGDFLRTVEHSSVFEGMARQTPGAYQVGAEPTLADVVRHALAPLQRLLDLDFSKITPRNRQKLLMDSRAKLMAIGSVLSLEFRDFLRLFEERQR